MKAKPHEKRYRNMRGVPKQKTDKDAQMLIMDAVKAFLSM
jgi:hypothetical protein